MSSRTIPARTASSIARAIVDDHVRPDARSRSCWRTRSRPATRSTTTPPIGDFYDASAERLAVHLDAGRDVVVLAEGDPLFYSSYMYLHDRLADRYEAQIVPGVTSVSAASAAARQPLVRHEDVLTVLAGHPRARGADPATAQHRRGGDHEAGTYLPDRPRRPGERRSAGRRRSTSSGRAPERSGCAPWPRWTRPACPTSR